MAIVNRHQIPHLGVDPQNVVITGNAPPVAQHNYFQSPSLTVAAGGWTIIGKPPLSALLRYWWRCRKF